GHLRVPPPGLVPEVHSRFEELTPRRNGHGRPSFGCLLRRFFPAPTRDRLAAPGTSELGPRSCVFGASAPDGESSRAASAGRSASGPRGRLPARRPLGGHLVLHGEPPFAKRREEHQLHDGPP